MGKEYAFEKNVRLGCRIMGVLLGLLLVTLPFGIWFWIKGGSGRLQFTDGGFRVNGLGLTATEWNFSDIQRIGLLRVRVGGRGLGGVLGRMISGGDEAVNVCCIDKNGKQKRFLVSRYEGAEEIVQQIAAGSGLTLETVSQGLMGPKWQEA